MTDREVMQQVLEALEELDGLDTETECVTIDVGDVIAALKAALEQPCIGKDPRCPCQDGDACHYKDCGDTKARPKPQAEPVAWMYTRLKDGSSIKLVEKRAEMPEGGWSLYKEEPLYTTPPQRKPLTDEEIWQIATDCTIGGDLHADKFARAVERAHNIKEQP